MSRSGRFTHRVDRYAESVLDGGVLAGPLVRLACERHVRDRERAAAGGWYRFDEGKADDIFEFFERVLRLPDVIDAEGVPQPFRLDVGSQFWAFVLGSGFGWIDDRGRRRFREWYIEAGKGTAKTPVLAGVGLFGLIMDGERAAEIYAAAADQEQASILFRDAVRIAQASPDLDDELEYDGGVHIWQIRHPASLSVFRTFSRESGQRSGTRPHMGLLDELHEHGTPETSVKVRAGAKRRPQPLFAEITNSGYDRTSICWQRHEHSRRVLERVGGLEDDQLFAYVCSLDDGDDPFEDEACWPKTNPYLGVTVTEDYLRRQVANAKSIPAETNNVLRLNFCVWTHAKDRFFDRAAWQACGAVVSDAELVGAPCVGAFDLGETDDFTAWVRVWTLADGRVVTRCRFWIPAGAREAHPHRPYTAWERAGLLTITEGTATDFPAVQAQIAEDVRASGVRLVGFDQRFARQMAQNLEGQGLAVVDIPQGFYLNEALRLVSTWVVEGRLCHGGDPVLSWMADNAVVRHSEQRIRLDKDAASDKIDGIAALAMAAAIVITQPPVASVEPDVFVLGGA